MNDQRCERIHEHRALRHPEPPPRMRGRCARALSCLVAAALAGCSASPSISVLGAFFPDWMFCVLGALATTLVVRAVLGRLKYERALGPPVIAYPALLLLISLLIWLLIFNS
ncbi:YtcA family lipoprotein [Paraburkholderia sp. JHI869]|uniref:YtcA family lipoprotein n=1 Tax=Paraburkholderia sp. JHI869 TaxID=3112959 RepID=UPI00316C3178